MRKSKEISNFFFSQYFADGLRITIGCIVPVIVCAYLGNLLIGTLISLGALLVGLSDTPGAPSHRRLGMLSTGALCVVTYFIIISVNSNMLLTTVTIAVLSFLFSMFAVFNARAATVGSMCVLMMIINIENLFGAYANLTYILYFSIGGAWYMLISLSITQIRPYRLAQQELSESIRQVSDFIRLKANFYDPQTNIDNNYIKLIEKQIEVHAHQENVRDLLFQSKRSIKDTTKTGRYLTLIFSDIVDLFEQSMTTQYDYNAIREKYADTGILWQFKSVLLKVTNEMDNIAYRMNANRVPKPLANFQADIEELKLAVERLEQEKKLNTIPLKKVIINIRTIVKFLENIYSYSAIKGIDIKKEEIEQATKFIAKDQVDWKNFKGNLSLQSSVFRHALRMAIVLSTTYLVLNLLDVSQTGIYWVLLTVMVILKPGFGLTKERNVQRLIGTIAGGIIGSVILLTIHDESIRFVILIFFFLTAYSLFRVNYIVAVLFMTPYVLIMLSFNGVNTFEMAQERIWDTFLGGTIAFLSSYIIFPNWESFQFRDSMRQLLIANYHYIAQTVQVLQGKTLSITSYKLARKEVYIASANMGSTFQRMLTEPKWRQKFTKDVNSFVILNHILSSFSANLLTQVNDPAFTSFTNEHFRLLRKILVHIEKAIAILPLKDKDSFVANEDRIQLPHDEAFDEDSKLITEQLQFLSKIAADLDKITHQITDPALGAIKEKENV